MADVEHVLGLLLLALLLPPSTPDTSSWEKHFLELKLALSSLESRLSGVQMLEFAFKVNHVDERLGTLDSRAEKILERLTALEQQNLPGKQEKLESGLTKIARHLQHIVERQAVYENLLGNVNGLLKAGVDKLLQKVDSILSIGTLYQGMSTNLQNLLMAMSEQEVQLDSIHDSLTGSHSPRFILKAGLHNITEIVRNFSGLLLGQDSVLQDLCQRNTRLALEDFSSQVAEFSQISARIQDDISYMKLSNNQTMNLVFDLYAVLSACHPPTPKRRKFFGIGR